MIVQILFSQCFFFFVSEIIIVQSSTISMYTRILQVFLYFFI